MRIPPPPADDFNGMIHGPGDLNLSYIKKDVSY